MFRYRKNEFEAKKAHLPAKCPLCNLDDKVLNPKPRNIIKQTKHALVMDALYPYDLWEWRKVTSHLMIVPRRHVALLEELTPEERLDIMDLMCEYDTKNYNVYARAPQSVQRTLPNHQHTHLIKTNHEQSRGGIYLKNPYFFTCF